MQFEGVFLGLEEGSFKGDDGVERPFYALHAWNPTLGKYQRIKVREAEFKTIKGENLKFGDTFKCNVEFGVDQRGMKFLRVVNW